MRYRAKAVLGLVGYIAAVEVFAPPGELISEAFDDWLKRNPSKAVAIAAVLATGGHLLNVIPERYDAYYYFGRVRIRHS